jgi:hypothetical protein
VEQKKAQSSFKGRFHRSSRLKGGEKTLATLTPQQATLKTTTKTVYKSRKLLSVRVSSSFMAALRSIFTPAKPHGPHRVKTLKT